MVTPAWQQGDVTLYLGDCLEVLPTLAAGSVDAVVGDPPYSSGGRQQATVRGNFEKADKTQWTHRKDDWFLGDNMGTDTYLRWMRQVGIECLRLASDNSPSFIFTDWRQYTNLVTAWESVRWTLRNVLVWDKAKGGAMGSWWRNNHEWVAIFTKGKARMLPNCSFFNTWKGVKPQGGLHHTEKPLGLLVYIVQSVMTEECGGVVLDPFMGSGTTGVACVQVGRKFIGIEIDQDYFDIAVKRISEAQMQIRLPLVEEA
jgi:site-specific DNA-methyltransferase (adenine-specific)